MEKLIFEDILEKIKQVDKQMHKNADDKLKSFGLTAPQGKVVMAICYHDSQNKPLTQKELETKLQCCKSTVSEFISKLIEKGFVYREVIEQTTLLRPTQKAINTKDSLLQSRKDLVTTALTGLDDKNTKKLETYLDQILENLKGVTEND